MTSTRRLTLIALLSAVSFVLMIFPQFPLIPGATFLKIDFSVVPVLIGTFLLDLKSGYVILFLRSLLKLLLNNEGVNDYIGLPMNIISLMILVAVIYYVVFHHRTITLPRYIVGAIFGTLGLTIAMVLLNYFYAVPLYAIFAHFDIKATIGLAQYIVWMVVPFNLIQGLILSVVSGFIYLGLRHAIGSLHTTLDH